MRLLVWMEDFPVQIFAEKSAGEVSVFRVWRRKQAGGAKRELQRFRFFHGGHIGVAAVKNVKVRHGLDASVAAIEIAQ